MHARRIVQRRLRIQRFARQLWKIATVIRFLGMTGRSFENEIGNIALPGVSPICCAKGVKTISDAGKRRIKQEEGKCNHVYLDSSVKCVPTIGYGLTAQKYVSQLTMSDPEIDNAFDAELLNREARLSAKFSPPVTQCQWDALMDLFWNYENNTNVYSFLNRKMYTGAGQNIKVGRWTGGILTRRTWETQLFLTGVYPPERPIAGCEGTCCTKARCRDCVPIYGICPPPKKKGHRG